MKHKLLLYSAVSVLGIGLLGAGVASAHGLFGGFGFGSNLSPDQIASHQQTMFQNIADLLGISVDEVKNEWAQGKGLLQIAQDHNITQDQLQQKISDKRTQQMTTYLQTLVDKGVITQAQMSQRLQFLQSNASKMGKRFHRGFFF